MEPGESWGYRARGIDPLVEVRVERLGTKKPSRALVAFVDESFEGKQEWVPPARLKVPWDEAGEYQAREARWKRVASAGPPREDPRNFAASEILDEFLDEELGYIEYREGDAIVLTSPEQLAKLLDLQVEQLTDYPETFTEDEMVIAPWPATELVAKKLAMKHAGKILERVGKEEREARHQSVYGRPSTYPGGSGDISPEICAEVDQEFSAPTREVLRSWCGAENVDRFEELIALRKEIGRVGDVAQKTIDALRANGQETLASKFQRELGTPVKELRAQDEGPELQRSHLPRGCRALIPRGMKGSTSSSVTSTGSSKARSAGCRRGSAASASSRVQAAHSPVRRAWSLSSVSDATWSI